MFIVSCSGCASLHNGLLDPQGPIASREHFLFFLVIGVCLVVVVPVLVLTPWLVWRYRRGAKDSAYKPDWEYSRRIEFLIWGVPIAVIVVLGVIVWRQTFELDPYRPLASTSKPLQVQVVSLDWKWLFIYPEQHIATVNELAIPVGRPVHLTLTSDTVMQSFMIPQLAGQIYTMAGMQTQLNLQADNPGTYRGENTQFNGEGFQKQKFQTLALSAADFAQWIAHVRASSQSLDCPAFAQLQKRDVLPAPQRYNNVQSGLFHWIVGKYTIHPTPACGAPVSENVHG